AEPHRSAQHFYSVSPHPNVGHAFAVARRPHIHFARSANWAALSDDHLFVAIGDLELNHPTRGTTGGRSRGWIFTAVKKHPCPNFQAILPPFRAEEIKEFASALLQEFFRRRISEVQIRERVWIAERHNGEAQPGRDRLHRPLLRNLVRRHANHARDFCSRKCRSELRVALAHFAEDPAIHVIVSRVLGLPGEPDWDLSGLETDRISNRFFLLGF